MFCHLIIQPGHGVLGTITYFKNLPVIIHILAGGGDNTPHFKKGPKEFTPGLTSIMIWGSVLKWGEEAKESQRRGAKASVSLAKMTHTYLAFY